MDNNQLCESLMRWLQTFDLEAPHRTVEEISDGVAMAEALNQIAPEWFDDSWMLKIKPVSGNNWRLKVVVKVSNLKKIIERITDYYHESVNQNLTEANKPDVVKIGEHCDAAELGKLLQLVLGCAINCNHKQGYITRIMAMEEAVQQVIMQSIQDLENSSGGAASFGFSLGMENADSRLIQDLEAAVEARDQMAQRCHELDMQVTLLQEEKTSVFIENKKLQERLKEFEHLEDSNIGSGHKQKELRKQLDTTKEDLFKMETSRDDYRAKVEMLEKELLENQSRVEELQKISEEARHLKDEVDILRETADQVAKHEATIASYKKKLEDYGDLKRQVKLLEDKNTDYMTQTMELEEELKKSSNWKQQLDMYKKQVTELHLKMNEETKRADKAEFEGKKSQDKLNALQREKERLIIERDSLKESNEELKCSQLQLRDIQNVNAPEALLADAVSETMIPPEIKEKLIRLQHENKMLRLNQRSSEDEKLPEVQTMLDNTTLIVNQLRVENRESNQRILELESKIEEIQEQKEEGGGVGVKQRIMDLQAQISILQAENESKQLQIDEKNVSLIEYKQKLGSAQDALKRKEAELESASERYQKYVEKAKSVIKSLDPKQNPQGSSAEVAILRNQLSENHKRLADMEEEKEQNKILKDREEHLISTAFYTLSLGRTREAVDHRLAALSSGQGQSFLARQRQATNRRVIHNFESR